MPTKLTLTALIGNESHTTSSSWAKVSINGRRMTHQDAFDKTWLTEYGDKHSSWSICQFALEPGDTVEWESGSNTGPRGRNRLRQKQRFVVSAEAKPVTVDNITQCQRALYALRGPMFAKE